MDVNKVKEQQKQLLLELVALEDNKTSIDQRLPLVRKQLAQVEGFLSAVQAMQESSDAPA